MRYRLLVGLVLLVMLLVAPAAATNLNFQNADDYNSITSHYLGTDGTVTWYENVSGGNNYIIATTGTNAAYIILNRPYQMTYSAATSVSSYAAAPILLKSDMTVLWNPTGYALEKDERYEVKISGGTAKLYTDNVLVATSPALATNPYYIGWGDYSLNAAKHSDYDDIVWGSSENMYVFGLPENTGSNAYAILHDTTDTSADGLVFDVNNTQVSSTSFLGTWARGSSSSEPTYTNESVNLVYLSTGVVYSTNYTGDSALAGSVTININNTLIGVSAPYGLYALNIPASGQYSNPIVYRSRGATITFDHDTYTTASTAVVTYDVEDAYWDSGTYSYRVDTMNVYGTVIDTQTVTTQTGTKNVTFASTDTIGVYYTVLIADPIASGSDIWMDYDYAELNAYVTFAGYVNDAETEAPMAAHINISQGSVAYDNTTSDPFDYTTNSSFYAGTVTDVNITASGYRQYTYSFTPLEAKTIALNFTLVPLAPAKTGLAIGGVFRDTVYGRPFGSGTAYVDNNTHDEHYSAIGNAVGYYLLDEDDGVVLTENRLYAVVGVKTGWHNSTIYNVTVVAS